MEPVLLDATGHRRSPATMPGYHRGRPPRNKGEQYPPDPPTVEEIRARIAWRIRGFARFVLVFARAAVVAVIDVAKRP